MSEAPKINPLARVGKTALGARVIQDRSVSLSQQQRAALILSNGQRSIEEILRLTVNARVSQADIERLLALDLIELAEAAVTKVRGSKVAPASDTALPPNASSNESMRFQSALDAAVMLCAQLGLKGFWLNTALVDIDSIEKLQNMAPEIRRAVGDAKYKPLHDLIFNKDFQ